MHHGYPKHATDRDLARLECTLSVRFDRIDKALRLQKRQLAAILSIVKPHTPSPRIPTYLVLHVGTPTQEF